MAQPVTPLDPERRAPARAAGIAWLPRGLTGRIAGLFLGLLLVVQATTFLAIQQGVDHNARASLRDDLEEGHQIFNRLLEQNAIRLSQGASLLAADFGFRDAVLSGDRDTLGSALENQAARIGANFALLLDAQGAPVAVGGDLPPEQLDQLPSLVGLGAPLAAAEGSNPVLLLAGRPIQYVVVPVKAPVLMGWVVMGFPLSEGLRDELLNLAHLQLALVARAGTAPWQVLWPGMDPAQAQALLAVPEGHGESPWGGRAMAHEAFTVSQSPRFTVRAVLWRPVDEALAPYRTLQTVLLAITGLGVLVFALGSVWMARRVTRPVRALVRASEQLGRGDYDTPLPQIRTRDEVGQLSGAFEQMRLDIAERNRAIYDLAYRDGLTGLPNRALLSQRLEAAMGQHATTSVLMLDLDRLKQVNDKLGYHMGDRLLVQVARRLEGLAPQAPAHASAQVARLGGDKFAILLPGQAMAAATELGRRVQAVLEEPLTLGDSVVDLTGSVGLAVAPDHAPDAASLLSRAEVAMYEAKHRRLDLLVYDPAIDSGSTQTLSLLSEMRRALQQDELRLFLQPKLDVAGRRLIGAEALVRWQHPERGLVPPMQFIPFAEETGFIHELTLWVVQDAARVLADWRARGLDLRLSINLSTHDLLKPDLLQRLGSRLAAHQVPARALCLEITESAIMSDPQRALQTLGALSGEGFKLSIDDFGTGYSSYATLKLLPVHELKIDMSFVRAMEKEPKDAMIVRSIIEVAHNLGLSVVAEGVENAAILEQLAGLACDEAQGWHIGKPMPSGEFVAWAEARGLIEPQVAKAEAASAT